ncbi:site-2 protease family protein [Methanolacinia paynteri]|uniref:site-2 protease family protein n=1 Tax=Methanolacinia paynteri TaxID=230356 RepID=UPI00064FCC7B|nr:site-2 protease family protein [Methanolacinia paynteri]
MSDLITLNWIFIILFIVALYLAVISYIKSNNLWEKHITFFGPFLALKTDNVRFLDWFRNYSGFFRIYGTIGAVVVAVVSVFFSVLMIFSFLFYLRETPPNTEIFHATNLLAIPGVNDFIPLTFAVIFGLVFAMAIHELGHGILARVEDMRVKSTGLLFFIIPIGAFVEPDEEDVEKARGMPKIRMYGAGITNNLVVSLICLVLLAGLVGMLTPSDSAYIYGVHTGYPAYNASIPPDSLILAIDGETVSSYMDVSRVLNGTSPGDTISMTVLNSGEESLYNITLSEWPEGSGAKDSGFMGISYYNNQVITDTFGTYTLSPLGPMFLSYIPINVFMGDDTSGLGFLLIDRPYQVAWNEPFPGYFQVIQVVFWLFWWNFVLGTFNALPLVPLDGGYILREAADRFAERIGRPSLGKVISGAVIFIVLFALIGTIFIGVLADAGISFTG